MSENLYSQFSTYQGTMKKQTGAIIMGLLILTGSVLLWDVTHQRISVEEAESPTSASGSETGLSGLRNLRGG